ncbi:Cadherin EGF LAG seven-pass G-type receptor 2 [Triplophysa tibetana]|uniref:Cadherin EGF LAG seven-pass G-type receptor 2 n=1 Tax=Triplophysa tibetana TaxID=1572043 RepID=A0A5A9NNZ2_9TELE|nr:Cadherin EGF LAG seven-pass G-type receptor 2 [Triplophysa tibetana]
MLGFLFLTIIILTCVRTLNSNKISIIANGSSALFISNLIFILGINQADNTVTNTHTIQFIVTDIVLFTTLHLCLDPEGYGNPDFCWLSLYDTLIWSLAGPIALVISMNVFLYITASRASCSVRQKSSCEKKETPMAGLRTACAVLSLMTLTCVLALLSVNSDVILFHYLFAGFSCFQGPFIFFFRVVFDKEARDAMNDGSDSDSDSDLSQCEDDQSGSFASTHSSDSEEDDADIPQEECWENLVANGNKKSHDAGGGETADGRLTVETVSKPADRAEAHGTENLLLLPNMNTQTYRGILKKKQLSPIAERNAINRIHNQLSVSPPDSASSRGPSSSEGRRGGAKEDCLNAASVLMLPAGCHGDEG